MLLQQHLYNGLASPAAYSILHRNGLARLRAVARLRVSPYWCMNGLARMDSVLAYGHRGLRRADVGTGLTAGRTR